MSRVHKTNFLASWEEIGDDYEMQDTYALTQMNSLEGRGAFCFDTSIFLLTIACGPGFSSGYYEHDSQLLGENSRKIEQKKF